MTATAVTEPDWQTFANGITTADDELAAEAGWRGQSKSARRYGIARASGWTPTTPAKRPMTNQTPAVTPTKAPRGGCGTVLYLAALSARGNCTTFEVHVVPGPDAPSNPAR